MVATGDIRVHEGKQDRLEQAAQEILEAVATLREADPASAEAVEAKASARSAVGQAMLASGVRRVGAVRT